MDKLFKAIEYASLQPEGQGVLFEALETLCLEAGRPDAARKARLLGEELELLLQEKHDQCSEEQA